MFTKKQLFRADISKGAMANKSVELTKYTWRLVCIVEVCTYKVPNRLCFHRTVVEFRERSP